MTRPMPGPPEKYQVLRRYVLVWRGGVEHYQHSSEIDAKRLTDAECAAEYWRAASDFRDRLRHGLAGDDLNPEWGRRLIWHRFARTPHALEES